MAFLARTAAQALRLRAPCRFYFSSSLGRYRQGRGHAISNVREHARSFSASGKHLSILCTFTPCQYVQSVL
ncbi:hypothetical protein CRG98_047995 [Punica granatum]|uniref:Uncharacterized protein n=1 Tax=Punica granatum TaxID=22663 RepID=A0A2I0HJ27_PUNGR|nr:hypothetical protein CRG98_047995 [Punica granatum]